MTKVAFFSTDFQFEEIASMPGKRLAYYGGTYHYRMGLPCAELAKHGWDTMMSWALKAMPDGHIRVLNMEGTEWSDDVDVIVFQRWMAQDGYEMAAKARAAGQLIIQDVDDLFWALPKSNIAHGLTDPKNSPVHNREHYRRMIGASSGLICSTDEIARWLAPLKVPTVVCRNAIDIARWPLLDPGEGFIGWIGGIAWRAHDLPVLRQFLPQFLLEHGLPFYHGGHDKSRHPFAWEQIGIDPLRTRVATAPLCRIGQYPPLWGPLGVALVPLEDTPFNRSKSWLKGLEASASGLPFVATDMPEYRLLGVGRLARNDKPRTWVRHLEELLDPEVRRAEGALNRARAEELDIAKQWHQWDDALRSFGTTVEATELVAA